MPTNARYILVPIDFCDYSVKAALLALEMAEDQGLEIVFLNAYQDSKEKKKLEQSLGRFRDYLGRLREEGKYASVSYSMVTMRGIPEEEIKRYVRENAPVFIIMGTRAADQKDSELIGSVTAEVLSFIPSPLIAIPDKIDVPLDSYRAAGNICYATNFSDSDIVVFLDLMKRLRRDTFKIRFVHVLGRGESAAAIQPAASKFEAAVREFYPYLECSYHLIPSSGKNTENVLNAYMAENSMDIMVVKQPSGKSLYNRLVSSLAQKLVYSAKSPLLVLPYIEAPDHQKRSRLVAMQRNLTKVNFLNRKRP